MARHHIVDGVEVAFTPEEETAQDEVERGWELGKASRAALNMIEHLEGQITPRRMRDHALGTGGDWLEDQEALIAVEREKL